MSMNVSEEMMAEAMREKAVKGRQLSKVRSRYNKNINAVRKQNPGKGWGFGCRGWKSELGVPSPGLTAGCA